MPLRSRWRGPARQSSQRQSGNGNRDRTGGQGGPRGGNSSWGASSPAQVPHVPVRGFNATEVKNALKKGKPRPAMSCLRSKNTKADLSDDSRAGWYFQFF